MAAAAASSCLFRTFRGGPRTITINLWQFPSALVSQTSKGSPFWRVTAECMQDSLYETDYMCVAATSRAADWWNKAVLKRTLERPIYTRKHTNTCLRIYAIYMCSFAWHTNVPYMTSIYMLIYYKQHTNERMCVLNLHCCYVHTSEHSISFVAWHIQNMHLLRHA